MNDHNQNQSDSSEPEKKNALVVTAIMKHPFESFALIISIIGIFGYAAGESFKDGWDSAAGVPSSMFAIAPYETILRGLSLESPWLYSAVALATIALYVAVIGMLDAWQTHRNSLVRIRRSQFEGRKERSKRHSLATAARHERNAVELAEKRKCPSYQMWKTLGSRGKWQELSNSQRDRVIRRHRYLKGVTWFLIQVGCILLAGVLYIMIKLLVVQQAHKDGVREYIGIYAAVTGVVPPQFKEAKISEKALVELICKGRRSIWRYRSVNLTSGKKKVASSEGSSAYVLQGAEKTFLLLSRNGSRIQSFGEGGFTLEEAKSRPLSKTAASCSN